MAVSISEMNSGVHRRTGKATVTISSGGTKSQAFAASDFCMFGMQLPTMTGTSVTFEVSADDTTYQALYDYAGNAVSMTTASSRSYDLPGALAAWPYIKLVSGSTEGATRSIVIVAKG